MPIDGYRLVVQPEVKLMLYEPGTDNLWTGPVEIPEIKVVTPVTLHCPMCRGFGNEIKIHDGEANVFPCQLCGVLVDGQVKNGSGYVTAAIGWRGPVEVVRRDPYPNEGFTSLAFAIAERTTKWILTDLHTTNDRRDRLHDDLKGARERLARAQTSIPDWWRGDLDKAIRLIDLVGSSTCPQQWSQANQPSTIVDDQIETTDNKKGT